MNILATGLRDPTRWYTYRLAQKQVRRDAIPRRTASLRGYFALVIRGYRHVRGTGTVAAVARPRGQRAQDSSGRGLGDGPSAAVAQGEYGDAVMIAAETPVRGRISRRRRINADIVADQLHPVRTTGMH